MSDKKSFFYQETNSFREKDHLVRSRIIKILENAVDYSLIVVYAGLGYGKTQSVYSFLQQRPEKTAWTQLSESDNEPSHMWEKFTNMVTDNWSEIGEQIRALGFPETQEDYVKYSLLRDQAMTKAEKMFFVYDDFHLLHNQVILRFFEWAISTVPANATIILISRNIPNINLTGMMLREKVFVIREDALCFTETEITDYFKQLQLSVSSQLIRDIYEDTQGWAFAINLIGRSLLQDSQYERYALEAMKKNVFSFIEADISGIIGSSLWYFFLRLSLIDHLATDLIKALTDDESLISQLEKVNAYVRYESFLNVYIIHHIFREYLQLNLDQLSEEEKQKTYEITAAWCEENEYPSDALSYYEKAKDYDALIRVVGSFDGHVPFDMSGYTLEIFDRIPQEIANKNLKFPVIHLKLLLAVGKVHDGLTLAKQYAADYESRPVTPENRETLVGIYYLWGTLKMVTCAYYGEYDFADYFKKMADFSKKSGIETEDLAIRQSIGAWVNVAGSTRTGELEEFIQAASVSVGYLNNTLNGNMAGFDDLVKGELHYFRFEFNDAEKYLQKTLAKAKTFKQYDIENRVYYYLMLIALFKGNFKAAEAALKAMEGLLSEKEYLVRYTTYELACGFYYISLEQPEKIADWLKTDFLDYKHPALLENYTCRVKLLYHFHTRQYSSLVAFVESELLKQPVLLGKVSLYVMMALALYQLKRKDEAVAALEKAYELAEPNGVVSLFIFNDKYMRTLSAAAMRRADCKIPREWLEEINRKSSAYAKRKSSLIAEYRAANQLDEDISLTKREVEILKDLSLGLSRTEIASSQNISINTVKMVINNLYDKLKANNLADAIRIAIEKKLI